MPRWWETLLPKIREELRSYVGRRYPSLAPEADDLTQTTLADLIAALEPRGDLLSSAWPASHEQPSAEDRRRIFALAYTILKRRIADHFAHTAREWAVRRALPSLDSIADGRDEVRRMRAARMLRCAIAAIAEASPSDRALVGRLIGLGSDSASMTPNERQRLHRLRRALAGRLQADLGDELALLVHERD